MITHPSGSCLTSKRKLMSSLHSNNIEHGLKDNLAPHSNADDLIVGEFLSNEQKVYMTENRIEYQMSMPHSLQQNGLAERFQQTIVNGTEAMRHHAGLSNSFWIYAVKAKLHTYNITPIKRADYETPTELWSSIKLNISHLRVFGCQAWVHILKKRRHKLNTKWSSLAMNLDPRDTNSGMQPTNASKFPVMWNSKNLYSLWKK